MGPMVYLNGKLVPSRDAAISIYDHGFLYGDGVFEGIRVYGRRVFKLREHIARLYASARAVAIELPISGEELVGQVCELVRTNEVVDGYIRISVSRGVGLGLDPRVCKSPTMVISTDELSLYPQGMYRNGLNVVTCSTRVPPPQALEPRVKSLGKYIGNIIAKLEANRAGAGEGLMLNCQGCVAECTGDNLFIAKSGAIYTPPASAGILEGITRNTVMDLARQAGYEVVEKDMTLFDVYAADECFLTGTAAEVIPVVTVDGRPIGDGRPGQVTREMMRAFHALTQKEGVPV